MNARISSKTLTCGKTKHDPECLHSADCSEVNQSLGCTSTAEAGITQPSRSDLMGVLPKWHLQGEGLHSEIKFQLYNGCAYLILL